MSAAKRTLCLPVLVIGVVLIVMPFVISLPSRASHGETMLTSFRPIMQPASVKTTAAYYYDTFVPLRQVAIIGQQAAGEAPLLIGGLAKQLHMTPPQMQQFLASKFPAMAQLLGGLPKLVPIFAKVPPGLNHYKPLVQTMQSNVTNYRELAGLPNFRAFTWFFVIPGVLLLLLGGVPLLRRR